MDKIYGYCRISRKSQKIDRQIRNIEKQYPTAKIYQEAFTGTKLEGRTEWQKLYRSALLDVKRNLPVTIVFDSVSRMSRNADEGIQLYFDLFEKNINLVFLKEPYINTDTYAASMADKLELTGTDEDEIFIGLNNYFRKLAQRQIRIAFEQSQKEVDDMRQRTKEGIQTARLAGKQIGQPKGKKYHTKKSKQAKEIIKAHSKSFNGTLKDEEILLLANISVNTLYKYKKEIAAECTSDTCTLMGQDV